VNVGLAVPYSRYSAVMRCSARGAQSLFGKRLRTCWNSSMAWRGSPSRASPSPTSNCAAAAASLVGYSMETRRSDSTASASRPALRCARPEAWSARGTHSLPG
jgi:hypothetical protein